jgi:hypothetical protein
MKGEIMNKKLKQLGDFITSAYGVIEANIRRHFWCILVILVITFLLTISKGSDADRLSIVSSVLSIALALIVVIFSIVSTFEMKEVVKEGWQKTEEVIKYTKATREGEKLPSTPGQQNNTASTEVHFDPSKVSWMTLIALYAISQSQEKRKPISKMGIASTISGFLMEELNINYTLIGLYSFFEGIIYGLICLLPENYITSESDTVIVNNLPDNFNSKVKERIESEEAQTPRGKKIFGALRPLIDAYFQ